MRCYKPNCPECDKEVEKYPIHPSLCTCRQPIGLYIPPGEHVHMTCPVHGDYIIRGGPVVY